MTKDLRPMTDKTPLTEQQLVWRAEENVVLATREWIASKYKDWKILRRLREAIKKYNRLVGAWDLRRDNNHCN